MKINIEVTDEQLSIIEGLGKDNDEGFEFVFGVGVKTLEQRKASQAKQSENMKQARAALRYVKAQGITL